jgi:hypothetical protein
MEYQPAKEGLYWDSVDGGAVEGVSADSADSAAGTGAFGGNKNFPIK